MTLRIQCAEGFAQKCFIIVLQTYARTIISIPTVATHCAHTVCSYGDLVWLCIPVSLHGKPLLTHLHTAPFPSSSQTPASLDALHSSSLHPHTSLLSSSSIVPIPHRDTVSNVTHIQHDTTKVTDQTSELVQNVNVNICSDLVTMCYHM